MTTVVRPRASVPPLGPRLAATIAVKILLLLLIWSAFVRGHQVAADADAIAAAFHLPASAAGTPGAPSSGAHHGQ